MKKSTYDMILIRWYPGKGKTRETIKRSVVAMVGDRGPHEQAEDRGVLGECKYSVWYYIYGYMSLYFSPKP